MCEFFLKQDLFVFSFMLQPDDPNYQVYADNIDEDQPFQYYVKYAEDLKIDEKQTLYIDYSHMVSFNWEDPQFIDKLMADYARFEPYLRKALTQFLADHGHQIV